MNREPVKLTVVEGSDAGVDPAELAAQVASAEVRHAVDATRGTRRNPALLRRRQKHRPSKPSALKGIVG